MTTERRSRPAGNGAAPTTAADDNTVPPTRVCWAARRRLAARRSVPLDCSCRDPWPCRCTDPPLSAKMVDAGRDAAEHLLQAGCVPLLETEVLQALWRRGGTDRASAERLVGLTGGFAA